MEAVGKLIEVFAYVLIAAIFLRSILSWTGFDPRNSLFRILIDVTEPILGPIRNLMPRMSLDLSPMIAIFLLFILVGVGSRLASGG
ncbi:MAG: YggT family protein [Chloroflexota bacterium]